MISAYDHQDYKKYLTSWLRHQPKGGRGAKSALAHAANCQLTYVSRVLNEGADFSLEQAESVSRFLGHTEPETEYFLLLVQFARAGTAGLKNHFQKKITEAFERRLVLKERFQVKMTLSGEEQSTYYSQWHYVAIHVLTSIPGLQSKEAIAKYLGIPLRAASEMIDFLISIGIVVEKNGALQAGLVRIHLGADSPLIAQHHTHWRLKAIQSFERIAMGTQDVHYSSVVSLSKEDAAKIRTMLIEMMEKFNTTVAKSPEEIAQCLAIDFFSV